MKRQEIKCPLFDMLVWCPSTERRKQCNKFQDETPQATYHEATPPSKTYLLGTFKYFVYNLEYLMYIHLVYLNPSKPANRTFLQMLLHHILKLFNFEGFSLTKIPFVCIKNHITTSFCKGGRIHFLALVIQSPAPFSKETWSDLIS
jgi:hypothetical protein